MSSYHNAEQIALCTILVSHIDGSCCTYGCFCFWAWCTMIFCMCCPSCWYHITSTIRGYYTSNLKLVCFVYYLKIINTFWIFLNFEKRLLRWEFITTYRNFNGFAVRQVWTCQAFVRTSTDFFRTNKLLRHVRDPVMSHSSLQPMTHNRVSYKS